MLGKTKTAQIRSPLDIRVTSVLKMLIKSSLGLEIRKQFFSPVTVLK